MYNVAAVDLGSNSFHMVIGREDHGELAILDRMRDPVRLAGGLGPGGMLDSETTARALASLERFGQRLRSFDQGHVRAVGTNTLRRLRSSNLFHEQACKALGVPIEILPGPEEARLIFLGVSHFLADSERPTLVIDIGGGSTEVVLGQRFEPTLADSLHMGCVSWTRHFFRNGRASKDAFRQAELAALVELEPVVARHRGQQRDSSVGSSGTIRAALAIAKESGWCEEELTLSALNHLRDAIISAERFDKLNLPALSEDRAPVIAGGLAILRALFRALKIESMSVTSAALREGLLYDLIGRIHHEDVRDRTISAMEQRYHIDSVHAARVQDSALNLFDQLSVDWELMGTDRRNLLSWAARLHELGMTVARSGHHRHGEYLLTHAAMPGFSVQDKCALASLVRSHRRKLRTECFEVLTPDEREPCLRLCVLLRIAARLHRDRSDRLIPELEAQAHGRKLSLNFPPQWLKKNPLTRADLRLEREHLARADFELKFS